MKPRDATDAKVGRSKAVRISLAIGLVVAGGLSAYGLSRPGHSPGPNVPSQVNVVETPAQDGNTRGTADIALPPVPVAVTTP